MNGFILMLLSINVYAANVPFFPRTAQANQDMGGINQDFSDISSCFHNGQTTTVTPKSCPTGQALTGAQYNSCGTTFGGTCSAIPSATSLSSYMVAIDSEASNTAMAACPTGSYGKVTLNTLIANDISASVSSSSVTLPSGTYQCQWSWPNGNEGAGQSRLFDSTHSTVLGASQSSSGNSNFTTTFSQGYARFVLSATSSIEVDARCGTGQVVPASNFGPYEVYTILNCIKVQ